MSIKTLLTFIFLINLTHISPSHASTETNLQDQSKNTFDLYIEGCKKFTSGKIGIYFVLRNYHLQLQKDLEGDRLSFLNYSNLKSIHEKIRKFNQLNMLEAMTSQIKETPEDLLLKASEKGCVLSKYMLGFLNFYTKTNQLELEYSPAALRALAKAKTKIFTPSK